MKYECVVGKLREINALSEKYFSRRIKELNMPILENHIPLFYVLPVTGESKLYNEIVEEWGISKSSISDIINKYAKLGYVIKYPCKEDKRTIYVEMTAEGREIRNQLHTIEQEVLNQFYNGFNNDEVDDFNLRVNKALSNINKL